MRAKSILRSFRFINVYYYFILDLINYDDVMNYMEEYLMETPGIDYMNPLIQGKVQELMNQSEDSLFNGKMDNSKFLVNFLPWHFLFCWFKFTI